MCSSDIEQVLQFRHSRFNCAGEDREVHEKVWRTRRSCFASLYLLYCFDVLVAFAVVATYAYRWKVSTLSSQRYGYWILFKTIEINSGCPFVERYSSYSDVLPGCWSFVAVRSSLKRLITCSLIGIDLFLFRFRVSEKLGTKDMAFFKVGKIS